VETLKVDLCAIGGGSGGRTVAAYARLVGASVALVEKGPRLGGECLLTGCVPSKSLLAAGHAAAAVRRAPGFGIDAAVRRVDADGVFRHVHGVIAAIEPHDSAAHFEELGVKVILAPARFSGPETLEVDGWRILARRFVVATGTSPVIPAIPGLDTVPFLTNETVFELGVIPEHLVVVGAGPMGVEMAQAFRRLGAEVTLIEKARLLPGEDAELVEPLRARLAEEGVRLAEGAAVVGVAKDGNGIAVTVDERGRERCVRGSHLLLAVGRRPNTEGLGLDAAGVAVDARGIRVDSRLRTTNRRVFAVGDVTGDAQFSHMAVYHAKVVIRNALFRLPARVDRRFVPRVTYCAPELAQVGLTEDEVRAQGKRIRVLRLPYADNHRALAERDTAGLIKVVVSRFGRLLGAGIVGPHAGEVIQTWCLALKRGLAVGDIAGMIAPYPTIGYSNRKVAEIFFTLTLARRWVGGLVRALARLP
jgi:pyruvate/2-oxoglutarate dehydrogenase complex dihydrolipoamide dehydrogenase (E3) component